MIPKVIVKLSGGDVAGIDVQTEDGEPIQVEVRQYHKDFQEGEKEENTTREYDYDAAMGGCYYEVIA